jgi:hypothetical protein
MELEYLCIVPGSVRMPDGAQRRIVHSLFKGVQGVFASCTEACALVLGCPGNEQAQVVENARRALKRELQRLKVPTYDLVGGELEAWKRLALPPAPQATHPAACALLLCSISPHSW